MWLWGKTDTLFELSEQNRKPQRIVFPNLQKEHWKRATQDKWLQNTDLI
jgi:hypothetical protein